MESTQHQLSPWVRYVDDMFVIRSHGQDGVDEFFNSLMVTIQFTMELEEDGKLPFFDVIVRKVLRFTDKLHILIVTLISTP